MCYKYVWSRKKFSWPNLQNLRKCIAFQAYGYSLYDMLRLLCGKYLNVLCVIELVDQQQTSFALGGLLMEVLS